MNGTPTSYATIKVCAVSALTLAAGVLTGPGQGVRTNLAPADAAAPSSLEHAIQAAKAPFDWLTWGGDLRIRNEYSNNGLSLTSRDPLHAQDYFRFRGRLWATATLATNVTINARLSAEPREWMEPAASFPFSPRPFTPRTANEGLEWRYGILDGANLTLASVFDQPLAVTLGRQDIFLGDGWLVADGTPGDRSWTRFLDGVRAVFEAREIKTALDMAYVSTHAYPGEVVPTLGNSSSFAQDGRYTGYLLSEQDEQGAIVNLSNNSIENIALGAFFIYKNDTEVAGVSNGDNANLYTIGASIDGTPGRHWQYSIQGAYQCGSKQDPTVNVPEPEHGWRPVSAYGANARLSYVFNDRWNNELSLYGELLSGDNPATKGADEMFDVLWGRWSRWSELSLSFYSNETSGKLAQLNNLGRLGPAWSFSPIPGMTFSAMYCALFAPEAVPTRAVTPGRFSLDGNFRGHYVQAVVKQQLGKHVSALLWGEWIWEGNYYRQEQLMTFLRAEVMFTF